MENTEQITKSNEFAKKHSITDNFLKWIVLFAMKNNLNQELMDNIFSSRRQKWNFMRRRWGNAFLSHSYQN